MKRLDSITTDPGKMTRAERIEWADASDEIPRKRRLIGPDPQDDDDWEEPPAKPAPPSDSDPGDEQTDLAQLRKKVEGLERVVADLTRLAGFMWCPTCTDAVGPVVVTGVGLVCPRCREALVQP